MPRLGTESSKWVILALAFFNIMIVMGTFFSSGVLYQSLTSEGHWGHQAISLIFGTALVCYALLAWAAGRAVDNYGPRLVMPLGFFLLGFGLLIISRSTAIWVSILGWGILVGLGYTFAGFVTNITVAGTFFPDRRGFASSVAVTGISFGTLIIVPLVQYGVDHVGWRAVYLLLGVFCLTLMVPLNFVLHGLAGNGKGTDWRPSVLPPFRPSLLIGNRRFWYLIVFSGSIGWLTQTVSVHQVNHLSSSGFSPLFVLSALGVFSLLRAGCTLMWGTLSDRLGREVAFSIGSSLCIVALLCLAYADHGRGTLLFYLYAACFAVGVSVQGTTQATAAGDIFGKANAGTVLGALELGWGGGGFVGTWFAGYWHDQYGSYFGALIVTACICAVGIAALWLAAPRRRTDPIPENMVSAPESENTQQSLEAKQL